MNDIRTQYKKAPQFSAGNTHEAMICKLFYSKKKFTIGVSYWTKEELKTGIRDNGDGTKSIVIEPLYLNN